MMNLPDNLKPFAEELARLSGEVLLRYHGRPKIGVELKTDDSPVTIADREAEAVMREHIMRHFPDHGIIGEEFGNLNTDAEWVWSLDPMDGTKSFMTNVPLYTTLIALAYRGEPVLGIIHQPVLKQLVMGDGAVTTLNGDPVRVRETTSLNEATLLTTCFKNVMKYQDFGVFQELITQVPIVRTWGDGYGYLSVATGWADIMCDPIVNPWDIAPLKPIIEGAGGVISDWFGGSAVGANSCIAATPALHEKVIRMLNK